MINQITTWIMTIMQSHGAIAVFIGVAIESIIVPIPSPLIIMGAGAVLVPAGLSASATFWKILMVIVLPGCTASTLGAYLIFGLAYWGGKPVIDRYHHFLGFHWDDVLWMEKKIEKRANLMIFLLRALPIVPLSLISAAAGVLRFPIVPFTLWTFLGSIPRNIFLAYLGFLARDSFLGLAKRIDSLESYLSLAIVIGAFVLVVWLRKKVKTQS